MSVANLRRILVRWWWLVSAVVLVSAIAAVTVISTRPDHYVSTGTFVVQPRAADQSDVVRATHTLSDAIAINSTFIEIAETDLIEARARARLGLEGQAIPGLNVNGSVVSRTNVLELSVRSRDPELSQEMAVAIGQETVDHVAEVSDVFSLAELDAPNRPDRPMQTGAATKVVAVMIIGFVIAMGLAALIDQLIRADRRSDRRPLLESETSMFNERYSALRLREEMSRTNDSGVPFRLAIMCVTFPWRDRRPGHDRLATPTGRDLVKISRTISPTLRDHDHLGHFDSAATGTFAALLPDLTDDQLRALIKRWRDSTTIRLTRSHGRGAVISTGSCSYADGSFEGNRDAVRIANHVLAATAE